MSFEDRVRAERIAASINAKLVPLIRRLEQVENEVSKLRGEFEVVRREAIRSVSEAVLRVKMDEVLKYVDSRLQRVMERQEKLMGDLVTKLDELMSKQRAMAELLGKISIHDYDLGPIMELREKLDEIEKLLKERRGEEAIPLLLSKLDEVSIRVEGLEKELRNRIEELKVVVASLQGLDEGVARLMQQVEKLSSDMEEISEKVDYLYVRARKVRGEEGEEE